jgi:hypothetical protein
MSDSISHISAFQPAAVEGVAYHMEPTKQKAIYVTGYAILMTDHT